MTAPLLTDLARRLGASQEQYQLHFAGQPRLTRDPSWLAALVADAEALVAEARDPALLSAALTHVETLQAELQATRAEQAAAGVAGCRAARVLVRVALTMHRYRRHFAGRPRPSRDQGLLAELREALGEEARALAELAPERHGQIDALLALLGREAQAIDLARAQGAPAARAAMLAEAANTLVDSYRAAVVGRRLLACRPALAGRLAASLADLAAAIDALPRGDPALDPSFHTEVVATLSGQAADWRGEAQMLARAHAQAPAAEVAAALDAELDDVLEAYNRLAEAGGPSGREALSPLCDRLDELCVQLRARAADPAAAAAQAAAGGAVPAAVAERVARDALTKMCDRWDGLPPA